MASRLLRKCRFSPWLPTFKMASIDISRQNSIKQKDEQLLATLGYKQEFKRAFTPLEVSWFFALSESFRLIYQGLWYRLFYNWTVALHSISPFLCHPKWWRTSHGVGGEPHHIYIWISLTLACVSGWWRVCSFYSLALPWPSLHQLLQLLAVYVWF